MQHRQRAAGQLQMEVPSDQNLREPSAVVGRCVRTEQCLHLLGKWRGPNAESKKYRCAKPNRGIHQAHKSQEPNHRRSVENRLPSAKLGKLPSQECFRMRNSVTRAQCGAWSEPW